MPPNTHTIPDLPGHHGDARSRPAPDPRTPAGSGQRPLDALREAGAQAGRDAADWWEQDTLGGRATGDTAARAARILAGLDDLDPAIVDALPTCDLSGHRADTPACADLYHEAVPENGPDWDVLDPHVRVEAIEAYRRGYDDAAHDRVAEHCHRVLGDDTTPDASGSDNPGARRRVA